MQEMAKQFEEQGQKRKKHTSKSIDCGKALAFNICPVQNDSWSAKGQLCSDSIS